MPYISSITLPSGNTYELKDAYARRLLAAGLSLRVVYDGTAAPVAANVPAGVEITHGGKKYTGTLAVADAEPMTFYLIKEVNNTYSEYAVAIGLDGSTKTWERLGDTTLNLDNLGSLAYKNSVSLSKGSGDVVLGEGTTFTAASSAVSFGSHTTQKVLGSSATLKTTQPTITVTPTKTNIKATASGTALTTGVESFVTSVTPTTKKLVTTTVPNVTSVGSASTWSFAMGTGTDAETLIISGGNGTAPQLGTAKTVATGAATASGAGATVVESVSSGTGSALTSASVSTQPTISLATGATAGTGVIEVATGISSATATGGSTTISSKDEKTVISAVGTATAAAQTITVGSNDKVTVAKYDDLSVSAN